MSAKTCEDCNGTGGYSYDTPCASCGASGVVDDDEEETEKG